MPQRWQVDTTLLLEAALPQVNVPNHIWNCPQFSLKNEPGPICLKLTGDLCQVVGRCASKMASGYHTPPWSSTAPSKCAKSHPEPPSIFPEKWTWSNPLETHRGPALWQGALSWRQQVHTSNTLEAVLPQVNVPNHFQSCTRCTTLVNLWESGCSAPYLNFLWKMTHGQPTRNPQGSHPTVRTTSPEDGRSIPLSPLKQHCPK